MRAACEFAADHRPHGTLTGDATADVERVPADRRVPVRGGVWAVGHAWGSRAGPAATGDAPETSFLLDPPRL